MNKKEALALFKEMYYISKNDSIANRENFHNFTDSLCKDRKITLKQYENWSNPYQLIRKSEGPGANPGLAIPS